MTTSEAYFYSQSEDKINFCQKRFKDELYVLLSGKEYTYECMFRKPDGRIIVYYVVRNTHLLYSDTWKIEMYTGNYTRTINNVGCLRDAFTETSCREALKMFPNVLRYLYNNDSIGLQIQISDYWETPVLRTFINASDHEFPSNAETVARKLADFADDLIREFLSSSVDTNKLQRLSNSDLDKNQILNMIDDLNKLPRDWNHSSVGDKYLICR